jgi:hypothetical protein
MFKAGGQQEATEFWKNDIITPVFKDNRSGFRTEGREKEVTVTERRRASLLLWGRRASRW